MKKLVIAAVLSGAAFFGAPRAAHAFCGFYVAPQDGPLYNDATMVALMRDGTRTVMSMSNNYKGPASDFAMVVPVPVVLQKENVKVLPHDVFKHLEGLSAPRLVEYWEQDPCQPYGYPMMGKAMGGAAPAPMAAPAKKADADYGVKIEAKFAVGEYEVVVLSAKQSDGLEQWLHDNKYNVPKGASSALAPYIKEQQKFFVAKVNIKKVQMDAQGVAVLSPLRFHYESQDFRLPVRLGLLNAQHKQDLLVWVLSKTSRYDVSNYANVFIPTNLEVADDTKKQFGAFYAALFDEAIAKAGGRAVVTEYAWTSAGCDPCPTPPLDQSEIAVLGGDVLFGMGAPPQPMPGPGGPMGGGMKKPMPPMWGGGYQPVVITRLHTRYDATTLTEDLVFRAAAAVVGGREFVTGADGKIEKGAQLSMSNNFQARYIIRHKWTGPVACQNPQRGIWGGPPGQGYSKAPPVPAMNIAAAPRGSVKLLPLLKAGMPAFDVIPGSSVLPTVTPITPPEEDAGVAPSASASAPPVEDAAVPPTASAAPMPSVEPKPGGCGCNTPGTVASLGFPTAIAFAFAALGRRKKKS